VTTLRSLTLCCAMFLAACGNSSVAISDDVTGLDDFGISEQSARVTPQQAQLAAQLVDSTRAYLPFAYTVDGCYARALYMSMELASRRVPSSAQYLRGELNPSASVQWGWHVAPMVEIDGTAGRTILDPSLAPGGPIPLEEWIRLSNPRGSYQLFWTLGSTYYLTGFYTPNDQALPVIQSFAELAPFQKSDLEQACGVMSNYLSYEGRSDEAQKRALLVGRTRSLANRLLGVGKLSGYQSQGALSCGGSSVPVCKEAQERCTANTDCCSTLCGATALCQPRAIDAAGPTPAPGVTDAGVRVDGGVRVDAGMTPRSMMDAGVRTDGGERVDAGSPMTGNPDAGTPMGTLLTNGTPAPISGAAGSTRLYRFEVPPGAAQVSFAMLGTSGDADLYVRQGTPPTLTTYDARPYRSDSNETVTTSSPRPGTWYVLVHAYSSYSSTTLTATSR
jgi:hypothetical protein